MILLLIKKVYYCRSSESLDAFTQNPSSYDPSSNINLPYPSGVPFENYPSKITFIYFPKNGEIFMICLPNPFSWLVYNENCPLDTQLSF
jgi:hypothetical protein